MFEKCRKIIIARWYFFNSVLFLNKYVGKGVIFLP
jgi:hypothetical protein